MAGKRVKNELIEWVKTLAWAFAIFFILRWQVVEAREIPSESMLPTLQINDRVITDKLVFKFTGLKRGDVIVFRPPVASPDPYIKRLIALPGERVAIHDGKVWINGEALTEPYLQELPMYEMPERLIPEGELFVLGDNRNQSEDSHRWGTLAEREVIGKAVLRYWPLNRLGTL